MSAISRASQSRFTPARHTVRVIVLTTVSSAADLARPLLAGAKIVLAAPPDPALAELAVAAAKCLSYRDYLSLVAGDPRQRARLEWLLTGDAAARRSAAALGSLTALEFTVLKERATRIAAVTEPLDRFLAALPDGWLHAARLHGSFDGSVQRELQRVVCGLYRRPVGRTMLA